MTDPLSLLPLSIAARGGSIDGKPVSQWVAAGLTLLQRSAPLVRALAGRRSAILLPTSAHFLTALGASEGRSALLLHTHASSDELRTQLSLADVGALFTLSPFLSRVPDVPVVLLDGAPRHARLRAGDRSWDIDLGSHFPLELEGAPDAPGSDEEVAVVHAPLPSGEHWPSFVTHGEMLARGREVCRAASLTADDRVLAALSYSDLQGLVLGAVAPLLCGASVFTLRAPDPDAVREAIARDGITTLVGAPDLFASLLESTRPATPWRSLRACMAPRGPDAAADLANRWKAATGVPLLLV